jgi:hypothetical protein
MVETVTATTAAATAAATAVVVAVGVAGFERQGAAADQREDEGHYSHPGAALCRFGSS